MGYVERHLLPGERVVYKTRLHWILFTGPVAVSVAGAALALWLRRWSEASPVWAVGAALFLVGLGWFIVRYVELRTSEFAVTSTRLIMKVGLVSRHTTELLLSKVESIAVDQGLVARLLNFGDLTVTGTGGAREAFRTVNDPIGFRNHVQHASLAVEPGRERRSDPSRPDR